MKRRSFLRLLAVDAALPLTQHLASANSPYYVGVGNSTDPYTATTRAITACAQWPAAAISGKTVMIKPNLVNSKVSTSGATTDPQVVRAVVDLALQAGAAKVIIAEGGVGIPPANFTPCGYDFFSSYDPRVQLMDFANEPVSLGKVPNGMTYQALYLPSPAIQPGLILISVAKMKTHVDAMVTLSMKNLFGLPSPSRYKVVHQLARMDGHLRGIDESIVDVNLARPISFSVIDGIWGMEGQGPLSGTPIQVNLVLAGINPVAVDRVALEVMGFQQNAVPHLYYAAARGLGPGDLSNVTVLGDPFTSTSFLPAITAPIIWPPTVSVNPFSLSSGQMLTIDYKIPAPCSVSAQIIHDSDLAPGITVLRTLQNFTAMQAGSWSLQWDGKNDGGSLVSPGHYLVRMLATAGQSTRCATTRVFVSS